MDFNIGSFKKTQFKREVVFANKNIYRFKPPINQRKTKPMK